MLEFFTSTTFQTVLSALNSGFLKTLQLFFITLIGALPLGLIISFGSMSRLAPLSRPVHWYLRKNKREPGKIAKLLIAFQPIRLVCRLMVWIIRGTPLVLQIIALFYVPGIQKWFNWPSGETGRMMAVCVAFIINYACYFSRDLPGRHSGCAQRPERSRPGAGHDQGPDLPSYHIGADDQAHRASHVQRNHHPGQGYLSGPG